MYKILIIGAGSIGNHMANACRNKGWEVHISDLDAEALSRMKREIYPSRYGTWDPEIVQHCGLPDSIHWDAVIVGTPPDTHVLVALEVLQKLETRVLLIEKPLTIPGCPRLAELSEALAQNDTRCLVGFNHNVTSNTLLVKKLITADVIGTPSSIEVEWLESWEGIFAAHPWLDGPSDSYLGYQQRGGGALCEHSHAVALWLHLADLVGLPPTFEVSATAKMVTTEGLCYDAETSIKVQGQSGTLGTITQNVVTYPAVKRATICGDKGFIGWTVGESGSVDSVEWCRHGEEAQTREFPKSRPDDFKNEIDILGEVVGSLDHVAAAVDFTMGCRVARFTDTVLDAVRTGKPQIFN